jgi:hypothetical protein
VHSQEHSENCNSSDCSNAVDAQGRAVNWVPVLAASRYALEAMGYSEDLAGIGIDTIVGAVVATRHLNKYIIIQ